MGSKNSIGDEIVSEGGERERERGGATVMERV